jgi:HEPN domain-containing protein
MSDPADLVRGWLRKGDSDLFNTRLVAASTGPYDTGCFHAQQAIEKYLKGFLAFHRQPIPHTHDLEELERLCNLVEPLPELAAYDLAALTDYAVQLRYDFAVWPTLSDIEDALRKAESVRALILAHLPPAAHP